jgi:hypothetical protein
MRFINASLPDHPGQQAVLALSHDKRRLLSWWYLTWTGKELERYVRSGGLPPYIRDMRHARAIADRPFHQVVSEKVTKLRLRRLERRD